VKRACYVSLPGGASHVATLAGAARALDRECDVLGWSGVSAGALVAIAKAFGVDDDKIRDVLLHWLQKDRILDASPVALVDGLIGVCHWERIPLIVDDLIGEGARMGDAVVPLVVVVTDLDTRSPVYFSKRHTPNALVREVARATSALVPLGCPVEIPSYVRVRTGELHIDGGFTDNTADAVWDRVPERRIAVRLKHRAPPSPVRRGDIIGQAIAVVGSLTYAEGLMRSRRTDGMVCDVEAIGDGMDFSLTETQILTRYATGHDGAARWLTQLALDEEHGLTQAASDTVDPAYWRGSDDGVRGAVDAITRMLDGPAGAAPSFSSPELRALAERVMSMRAALDEAHAGR